jgi:hypothetical protein
MKRLEAYTNHLADFHMVRSLIVATLEIPFLFAFVDFHVGGSIHVMLVHIRNIRKD